MKKFIVLLLCTLLLPVWAAAQKGFVKGKLGEELDDVMTAFGREGYSGAVLVAQNGEIILQKGYGLADRERKIHNTPSTLFNVASVGKIFTAAAILKLEMRGKLKTSDFISKHLEENTAIIFTVNNDLNFRRRVAPAIEQVIWRK